MKKLVAAFGILLIILFNFGCNINSTPNNEINDSPVNDLATDIPQPIVEATVMPTETLPPPSTPTEIIHQNFPGDSPRFLFSQTITDCNTGNTVNSDNQVSPSFGCDRWHVNSLERPHNQSFDVFYDGIDIISASFAEDDGWIYGRIKTFWASASEKIHFAIELDTDFDTRGDFLVFGLVPNNAEWTTDGVQVWADSNKDVGGRIPIEGETRPTGNGYDRLIFDSGVGDDPDLAWIRNSPESANGVEIAFNPSFLNDKRLFQWMMWTVGGEVIPSEFEYVDFYNETDKYALDNTCTWTFGSAPRTLQNSCSIFVPTATPRPTARPDAPPTPCPPGSYLLEGRCQIIN